MQNNNQLLSPKLDVVFKSIFSKKGNEDLLEDLLGSILNKKIKCKQIVKEARIGEKRPDEKYGTLDIKVILESSEEIDIEMQIIDRKNTINRALYYMSLLTTEDLTSSQDYSEMKQKIVIFLLDFNLFNYKQALNESYLCIEKHRNYELSSLQKYYFIELPKISTMTEQDNQRLKTWMAFLNQDKEMLKMVKDDKIMKKAQDELEYLTGDEEIKRLAELRQKAIRDEIASKRIGLEEGLKKGIQEGRLKGRQEGISYVAKAFLKKGIDIKLIMECTGLSKDQLESLK